jgi:hypothetical protein
MTEIECLQIEFHNAETAYQRALVAEKTLADQFAECRLTASPARFAELKAALEQKHLIVAASLATRNAANDKLGQAQRAESLRAQREADRAQLNAKQSELRQAGNALAEKKTAFQRLAGEIPAAEARVFVLMQETAILQQRVSPLPKQSQPKWYDAEWNAETARRGGDLAAMLGN